MSVIMQSAITSFYNSVVGPDTSGVVERSMINKTTGFSPNMMMLGRKIKRSIDIFLGQHKSENKIEPEYVKHLIEKLKTVYEEARKNIKTRIMYKKKVHDEGSKLHTYTEGDVYRLREETKKGFSKIKPPPLMGGTFHHNTSNIPNSFQN